MAINNQARESLLSLFERPQEPVFYPKGSKNIVFDVPQNYLSDRFQSLGPNFADRFGAEPNTTHVSVKQISIPDLSVPLQLKRRDQFSLFIPSHRKMASRMIQVMMSMRSLEDFQSLCVYCRDRLNPYLFIYCYSVAILHRPETKNMLIPNLSEIFPEKFMDRSVFSKAREEISLVPEGQREPIVIPRDYTGTDLDEEHRVAYYREDLGLNLHHWHWHLVYPSDATPELVNKDRRGELFYYMHQQIIARYNIERFSNRLKRVKRLSNFREPIEVGYFPKLDTLVASRNYPGRHAGATLKDINRQAENLRFDIQDLERWRDRIFEAIHTGAIVNRRGERIVLDEARGIDILGNILEASILTPNDNLYGDLHNFGHMAIGFCHDPDNRYLENMGVMGDLGTTMRDPVFFSLHSFVDDIFHEHKATLPRYQPGQLDYPGITVTGIEMQTGKTRNQFNTHWQQSDVEMSRGLDFLPRGSVLARFTHLNHEPFSYKIQVNNSSGQNLQGTVRIFVAPKADERGLPMHFRDQRILFIELDKFQVPLKPGNNTISRQSTQSSVTVPFERTFRNLDINRPTNQAELENFNFCGCGWPQHLLIPKGTPEGYQCDLFVMVTNAADDRVQQNLDGVCNDAESYCGIRDRLYPDKRPMGFPFDRPPRDGVNTLSQFMTGNMRSQDVVIRFQDRTVVPSRS